MKLAGQGMRVIRADHGYAMAALLVGLSVMAVLMSAALPVWSQMTKREREEELIFRGKQYARAVGLFQRKFANAYPPTVDVLVEQRFLRKKYKDPITNDDFQLIPAGGGPTTIQGGGLGASTPGQQATPQAQPASNFQMTGGRGPQSGTPQASIIGTGAINLGIAGVVSKSKDTSIKIYNGRQKYNEWAFVYIQTAQAVGPGGGFPGTPSVPGRGGPPVTFMPAGPGGAPFGQGQGGPFGPGGRGGPPGGFQPMQPGGGGGFQPMQPGGVRPPVPFGQPQPGQGQQPFGQPPFQPFGGRGQPPKPPGS